MMRIVYQEGAVVKVLIPVSSVRTPLQTGRRDVPAGVPFWIVPAESIPTDRTMRDAWELAEATLGEPDGYGGAA